MRSATSPAGDGRRILSPDFLESSSLHLAWSEWCAMMRVMCRNIRVLHHFEPPTTPDEIRAAALQYVRKVSGSSKPTVADDAAFHRAVDDVTEATTRLLAALRPRAAARTRDGERAKAKHSWERREHAVLRRRDEG